MPKHIKFNLIIDKNPIRDMEDLSNNFNIDDILASYKNGSLSRWLLVRNETDKIKQLEKIKGDTIETALELSRIFLEKECNKEQLASAVYAFDFKEKEKEKLKQFESAKTKRDEIIRAYHEGYEKLLGEMEANGLNYPFLKAAVKEIRDQYNGLYLLDKSRVYQRFISSYLLIILTFIANRSLFEEPLFPKPLMDVFKALDIKLLQKDSDDNIALFLDKLNNGTIKPEIKKCVSGGELEILKSKAEKIIVGSNKTVFTQEDVILTNYMKNPSLPFAYITVPSNPAVEYSHVKTFSGETNDYWKDLEQKGEWMIICIEPGNFVRNLGRNGEELGAADVNGKFPILKGIDYKSKSNSAKLIYMEV